MAKEKCLVHQCQNHAHQGNGLYLYQSTGPKTRIAILGWICAPCLDMVIKGKGKFSQVYHNAVEEYIANRLVYNALQASIHKWAEVHDGRERDLGSENCPLCALFSDGKGAITCGECPVYKESGVGGCEKTPYPDWIRHQHTYHKHNKPPYYVVDGCRKCKELSGKVLNYAISLEGWI
jgi:hypothetical protein